MKVDFGGKGKVEKTISLTTTYQTILTEEEVRVLFDDYGYSDSPAIGVNEETMAQFLKSVGESRVCDITFDYTGKLIDCEVEVKNP